MNGKKLYKSRDNRMISGVCAGIAEYFNMDPTIIRLAWVLWTDPCKQILFHIFRRQLLCLKLSVSTLAPPIPA